MTINSAEYWNSLYRAIPVHQFTWFEQIPVFSLKMITMLNLPLSASIIDVGGGTGYLAKQLLALGYTNITVLDFSEEAIAGGRLLLGDHADSITWLTTDLLHFKPDNRYDFWHDRACLHYLQDKAGQLRYAEIAGDSVAKGGHMMIAAASPNASDQSAGLTVQRFSPVNMRYLFADNFHMEISLQRIHITPANRLEPYTYFSFTRKW
jgi:SAM-dependent methyltransferase